MVEHPAGNVTIPNPPQRSLAIAQADPSPRYRVLLATDKEDGEGRVGHRVLSIAVKTANRFKDCQDRGNLVAEVLSIGVSSPRFDHRWVGADPTGRGAGGELAGKEEIAMWREEEREESDKGDGQRDAPHKEGSPAHHQRRDITVVPAQVEAGDIGTERVGEQDDGNSFELRLQEAGDHMLVINQHIDRRHEAADKGGIGGLAVSSQITDEDGKACLSQVACHFLVAAPMLTGTMDDLHNSLWLLRSIERGFEIVLVTARNEDVLHLDLSIQYHAKQDKYKVPSGRLYGLIQHLRFLDDATEYPRRYIENFDRAASLTIDYARDTVGML